MSMFRANFSPLRRCLWLTASLGLLLVGAASAQICETGDGIAAPERAAFTAAAERYFDLLSKGDASSLKQNAISSLAGDFSSVENAVNDNHENLAGTRPSLRSEFWLKLDGSAPLGRAEFLCGVFGKTGQTANSAEFVLTNLAPGTYAVVMEDATTPKGPLVTTFVLVQQGADWKLGGLYIKDSQAAGKDFNWYAEKAAGFKDKGQNRNAWFYYTEARNLAVPVPFMYTQATDRIFDESEPLKPSDLPAEGTPVDLTGAGQTYKLTQLYPLGIGQDFDLIVKYQAADVSDSIKTYDTNMAVIKALLAKYPEFRDGFAGVVARAVEPSGKDYGSLAMMKDIK
ncbi:MAG TPA: hypothetical protein VF753_04385 [Terriglobales bacterium]